MPRVGMRIVKTFIAVFICMLLNILFMLLNKWFDLGIVDANGLVIFYTPFFATIAAVYCLHRDKKNSLSQAKIRSVGTVIGGYFGLLVIIIADLLLVNVLGLNVSDPLLYKTLLYVFVSICIIPLIYLTVIMKQNSCVFITCLTYLSVTISIRNMQPVYIFATNRVISTLTGIGIALLINNISLIRNRNKNLLFVASLPSITDSKNKLSPYSRYTINDMYFKEMPLSIVTQTTLSAFKHVFDDVDITFPFVVMDGAAIYHFDKQEYENVFYIDNESESKINSILNEMGVNAFCYCIYDNILYCYYKNINNVGEQHYYNIRRKNAFDNFVRADVLTDIFISQYTIINKLNVLNNIINKLEEVLGDAISYDVEPYEIEGYYSLNIISSSSTKVNLLKKIKGNQYEKVIVCIEKTDDLPLLEVADFSFCMPTADNEVKERVDCIIKGKPDKVLRIFNNFYHSYTPDLIINYLKNKYKK
mgnify:CR=1 FL=1